MELDFRPFDGDNHYDEPQRILFGSNWPHGEGLAEPLTFSKELTAFSLDEVRMIMCDDVIDLLGGVTASE